MRETLRRFLGSAAASAARGLVVASLCALGLLGAGPVPAQSGCGFLERSLTFADGSQACLADFPFLQRRGLIAGEPEATYASKAKTSATYAVAITAAPPVCPFASYMAWNWSGHDDKEALPRCDARMVEVLPRAAAGNGCRCEAVLVNGRSPLTREAFTLRLAQAERQLLAGGLPLGRAAADVARPPAAAPVAAEPPRIAQAERDAETRRQAEQQRKAEADRFAEAESKAQADRQAEAARASEAERLRAEARAAEVERARLDREMAELRRKLDEQARVQEAAAARLSSPAAYADRVALIVGNTRYAERPLVNPVNDARALRQRLETLGFRVLYFEDVKVQQIGDVYEQLHTALQARPGSAFVFYYAGHGMQIDGENFFPSVDAKIASRFHMPSQSLDVARIVRIAESARSTMRLLILDACRDNPWQMASRGSAKGLSRLDPAEGTLILHATRPGSVALDESRGAHGLFTFHLLRHFDTPRLPVERMFKLVAADVRSDSGGRQVPWIEGQLVGDFAFVER